MDTDTPAESEYLGLGALALTKGHPDIPDNSLVRVVCDEGDDQPAVEVLIPTGHVVVDGPDLVTDTWQDGEALLGRAHMLDTRIHHSVHPGGSYHWCRLYHMRAVEGDHVGRDE